MHTVRRILAALDARGELDVRWRGAGLDRTIDERHARLVGVVVATLAAAGWLPEVEVTYAIYGERGSIDILAFHLPTGSLLVIEVKTELASMEETLRRLDEKLRLGRRIARERFVWAAVTSSRLLILSEGPTNRRRVRLNSAVLDATLPAANVEVRRWLDRPTGTLSGRWFLSITYPGGALRGPGGPDRVFRPKARALAMTRSTNPGPSEVSLPGQRVLDS